MATVPNDYELSSDQRDDPVLWVEEVPFEQLGLLKMTDTTDFTMERYLGGGRSMKLKSFGHDEEGRHFLLTRAGTTVHTDKAYTRYSHQVVLRNDGNRLRGLPRYDRPDKHPMLLRGVMYALDTHSPHQGLADARFADRGAGLKAVIAVDRDEPLTPAEVLELLQPWFGLQFSDVRQPDPNLKTSPRTRDGRPVNL